MKKIKTILRAVKKEYWLIILLLVIAAVAHGFNMFHYPYYEDDEGTYMSQAWSLLTIGKLAPYTYWYDHAPLGWIFIAMWVKLVGGFFTFGTSVETGRVFMLVLHLFSTLFLYIITKRLTKSKFAATIACLIFSVSPLAIYFQRRVLLDNIMTFWVLLTLLILTVKKLKLRHIYLSALTLSIGVLSKENAVFFIPGFLFLIWQRSHIYHRSFALIKWLAVIALSVSMYFTYALIKGEFFPTGTWLGGTSAHVSLLSSIQYQVGRSGGSILNPSKSQFWHAMGILFAGDKLLILGGVFSTFFISILSFWRKKFIPYALFSIFFWYYLIRASVIDFYVVPLIPILALLMGLSILEISIFISKLVKRKTAYYSVCIIVIFLFGFYYFYNGSQSRGFNIYTTDQTKGQLQALTWIRENLPIDSVFAMDNYGYVDLHSPQNPSTLVFPYAEYYWKVDRDPAIQYGVIKNDPANIDLTAVTPQLTADLQGNDMSLLARSMGRSFPTVNFWTNGWGVTIWQSRYPNQIMQVTWSSYKKNFILSSGRSIDPVNSNNTTSEAQSYALLRAVWENDQKEFISSWEWTKNNMQLQSGLFGWKWIAGKKELIDAGSASDADEDIALALLFASKQWNNPSYLQEAKIIIQSIWQNEVKTIQGTPYLVAGNWGKDKQNAIINPSYLSPYSYRIFAQVDTTHPWASLVDSSYKVFSACSDAKLDVTHSVGLMPDWCAVNPAGEISQSPEKGLTSTSYSFDAFRSTWRIALDYLWNKDPRAKSYLTTHNFLRKQWEENGKILVGYTHDGKPWENYESAVAYGADIGNFVVANPKEATDIYNKELLSKFYQNSKNNYWEDPKNYYTQNWAWFGTALYSNNLPNPWSH